MVPRAGMHVYGQAERLRTRVVVDPVAASGTTSISELEFAIDVRARQNRSPLDG